MDKKRIIGLQIIFSYLMLGLQIVTAPILIVLLTKFLTVAEYGVFSLFTAFVSISFLLLQFGIFQYFLTKIPGKERDDRLNTFLPIIIIHTIFLVIIFSLFYFSKLSNIFLTFNNLTAYSKEFSLCLVLVVFYTTSKLFDAYFQAKKKINTANFIDFVRNKGWIVLIPILIFLNKVTLFNILLVWGIGIFLILVFYGTSLLRKLKKVTALKFNFDPIRKAIKFGLPLIATSLFGWIISSSDRYILNYYIDTASVGIYNLAYSIVGIIFTVGVAGSIVVMPYFAEEWNKKGDYNWLLNFSLKYGLCIVLPGIIAISFLREEVILLISNINYMAAAPIIPILAIFPLFALLNAIFQQPLLVSDKTKKIAGVYFVGAILNAALNLMLIPKYGIKSAAITTGISYFAMAVLTIIFTRKLVKIDFGFLRLGRVLGSGIVMGFVIWQLKIFLNLHLLVLVGVGGLVYLALLFVTRAVEVEEIKEVLKRKKEDQVVL
jgi:O-antigen/teichoic acid export membrane protein